MIPEELQRLINKKEGIEQELLNLERKLKENHCDMEMSLIDLEGFPKAHLDIPTIRSLRIQIIRLKNDLKQTIDEIEIGLHEYHASINKNKNIQQETSDLKSIQESQHAPFILVNQVTVDGPGYHAGLRKGDRLTKVGDLTTSAFENLIQVAEILKKNEDKVLKLEILRGQNKSTSKYLTLELIPTRKWGNGSENSLLGCHLLPYKEE